MENITFGALTPNLMVNDARKSLSFYNNILGFNTLMTVPPEPKSNDTINWAMVQKDDAVLMLHFKNNLIEEYPQLNNPKIASGLTLFIKVNDVESLYKSVKGKATIVKKLSDTFYGTKEFAITDADGYILTFAQS